MKELSQRLLISKTSSCKASLLMPRLALPPRDPSHPLPDLCRMPTRLGLTAALSAWISHLQWGGRCKLRTMPTASRYQRQLTAPRGVPALYLGLFWERDAVVV